MFDIQYIKIIQNKNQIKFGSVFEYVWNIEFISILT
jgi:hypothetical protein